MDGLWTEALRYIPVNHADFLPPLLPEDGWETRSSSGNTIAPTWKWQDVSLRNHFLLSQQARRRKKLIQVPSQEMFEGHRGLFFFKISLNTKSRPASELNLFVFTTL